MSTENLIEVARQADAIFGDQDDGVDGFEKQMRRALARPHPVRSDAIGVLMQDIEAAMFVCGHELIRSRDAAGNLQYRVGGLVGVGGTQPVDKHALASMLSADGDLAVGGVDGGGQIGAGAEDVDFGEPVA